MIGLGAISADDLKFWQYWPRLKSYLLEIPGFGQEILGWISTYSAEITYESQQATPDQEKLGALIVARSQMQMNYQLWADYEAKLFGTPGCTDTNPMAIGSCAGWLSTFQLVDAQGAPSDLSPGTSGLGFLPLASICTVAPWACAAGAVGIAGVMAGIVVYCVDSHEKAKMNVAAVSSAYSAYQSRLTAAQQNLQNGTWTQSQYDQEVAAASRDLHDQVQNAPGQTSAIDLLTKGLGGSMQTFAVIAGLGVAAYFILPMVLKK